MVILEKLKFLEEAIETAGEEIIEEAEVILNKTGDPEVGATYIIKVVKDLLETAKHFEKYKIEKEKVATLFPEEESFNYELGDKVNVKDIGKLYTSYPEFGEKHGHPHIDSIEIENGMIGIVVARGMHEYRKEIPLYIILIDSKKYIIEERGIERWEINKFEYKIGEEVVIQDEDQCYDTYERFGIFYGHGDVSIECGVSPKNKESGIVLARGYHEFSNVHLYIVEVDGTKFIMEEKGLKGTI